MVVTTAPGTSKTTNFLSGGLSGCIGISIIQPVDMIKVRIQLASSKGLSTNPFKIARDILAKEGATAFYHGLPSALLRQCLYGSSRLGIFYSILDYLNKTTPKGEKISLFKKGLAGIAAGGLASGIAVPTDLVLVRMQSDITLPENQRRNYTSVFNAFMRIPKEEGFLSMWTGATPTIVRAMAINFCMLVPFEEVKERLEPYIKNGKMRAIISSLIASVLSSAGSLPFDNIKTKLQHMRANADGVKPYSGIIDCFSKTVSKEGFAKLWVGFPTYYVRIGPAAVIILLLNDFFRPRIGSIFNKQH